MKTTSSLDLRYDIDFLKGDLIDAYENVVAISCESLEPETKRRARYAKLMLNITLDKIAPMGVHFQADWERTKRGLQIQGEAAIPAMR